MKILVTGGAGYVGTALVKMLAQQEEVENVLVYDNLSRGNYNLFLGHSIDKQAKVTFINGELLDSRKLRQVLDQVEVVYHLAARVATPFHNIDSHFYEQINHWGTAELVYAVEESKVNKFIYTSSTSVYGSSKKFADEKKIPNPRTFYGISKLRGEDHVKRLMTNRDAYILRLGNIFGYSKSIRFDGVINRFMLDANFSRRISIHGNGKQSRAFIHIDNIASLLCQLAFKNVPAGTYNMIEKNFQILDIVDVLKEIYPDLEFIFINQHLDLREMKVNPECEIFKYLHLNQPRSLKDELITFKSQFAF